MVHKSAASKKAASKAAEKAAKAAQATNPTAAILKKEEIFGKSKHPGSSARRIGMKMQRQSGSQAPWFLPFTLILFFALVIPQIKIHMPVAKAKAWEMLGSGEEGTPSHS